MGVNKVTINGQSVIDLTNTDLVSAQAPVDSYFYQANGVFTEGQATGDNVLDLDNITFTSNGTYYPSEYDCNGFSAVTVNVDLQSELEGAAIPCEITSNTHPKLGEQTIEVIPASGKFFNKVTVGPVGGDFIQIKQNDINNKITITENTFNEPIDVRKYSLADVQVSPKLQEIEKNILIEEGREHTEIITAGEGYDGIEKAIVNCSLSNGKTEYYTTNLTVSPSDKKQIFVPSAQDGKPGYYSDVTIEPIFSQELVVSTPGEYTLKNGYYSKVTVESVSNIETVNEPEKMDDKLVSSNIGKVFQYTGSDDGVYTTNGLYIVTYVDD